MGTQPDTYLPPPLCLGRATADAWGLSDKFRVWLQRQGLRASRAQEQLHCPPAGLARYIRVYDSSLWAAVPKRAEDKTLVELRIRARPSSVGFR